MIELHLKINDDMRACKTRFWKSLETNQVCDPEHVTLAAARQLTGEKRLESWWKKPGFAEWFCEADEFSVKMSAAKFNALDTLIDVMSNPDSPASSRVAAAKQVMDYARNMEKDTSSLEDLLDKIAGVSKVEDLQKYLK